MRLRVLSPYWRERSRAKGAIWCAGSSAQLWIDGNCRHHERINTSEVQVDLGGLSLLDGELLQDTPVGGDRRFGFESIGCVWFESGNRMKPAELVIQAVRRRGRLTSAANPHSSGGRVVGSR